MPWEEKNRLELREEFVKLALSEGVNLRELSRRYGISAPTAYKWIKRYRCEGVKGLEDRSRRPHEHPNKTSKQVESHILDLRKQHDYWGARKLHRILQNRSLEGLPSSTTVHNILKRNGCIESPTPGANAPKRFERKRANELWQMDFKGDFGLSNHQRCHALTLCDDHSRYNLVLKACADKRTLTVKEHLIHVFERYGLPECILCDNSGPWGCASSGGIATNLELWLIRVGVSPIHGRPLHPQTQGKEERFHGSLERELLSRTTLWKDLKHCQRRFDQWRHQYNYIRPHESIDMCCPYERYEPSQRSMPSSLPEIQSYYLDSDIIRKVKSKGEIMFKNHTFYIGRGFIGALIALRQTGQDQYELFYCWKSLGYIDLALTSKAKHNYEKLLKSIDHRSCCTATPMICNV